MTTMTEEEAEIDEKCMFAVHAKQLSQYLRHMYGHLVNANTLKPFMANVNYYMLSPVRLSVVCNVCVPYLGCSNFPQYF